MDQSCCATLKGTHRHPRAPRAGEWSITTVNTILTVRLQASNKQSTEYNVVYEGISCTRLLLYGCGGGRMVNAVQGEINVRETSKRRRGGCGELGPG